MKYFFEIENWQKGFGCISIGKQCFHHIHVPYTPGYWAVPKANLDVLTDKNTLPYRK
jgi:hypothetical protein